MKSAARGLGLLVFALAVLSAAAWWILHENEAPRPDGTRAQAARAVGSEPTLSAPAGADPASKAAAERAEEAVASAPAAAPEAAASFPTSQFLSGVVVDDNGRPVVAAEVSFGLPEGVVLPGRGRLARFARSTRGPSRLPDPVRTRTGSDGAFRLERVPRLENLELRIDHPDYVLYTRGELIVPSSGMELGRIGLTAGAIVSGQVFGPAGAKVAGAEVSLRDPSDEPQGGFRFLSFDFGPRGRRVATTDAEGRFRITGLPAGRALVVADAEELCESASPPIELVALQEVGNVVLHLERGHSLEGVVTDAGGRPVEGARVNAVTGDGFGRVAALMRGDSDATTGGDGRFAIRGLTPGVYEVSVEADGFAPKSLAGIDPATSPPLEFMLSSSARVSGTVRLKGSGAPASGVKVQLVPWWGEDNALPAFDLPDVENKAAEEGAFVIEDVEPGQYRVAARGEGTTRAFSAPITIAEGANVDGVFVEVERGAVLSGRVVDAATGAPVPDAEVVCFQPSEPANAPLAAPPGRRVRMTSRIGALPRLAFDPFRRNAGRAKCDAEGRFRIEHLSAGGYVLDASHADYATARTEEIEVAAAEVKDGAEVRLGRGGTVEGLVTGIDGKPRAGDRVDVESRSVEGVTRSALCDANGWYRIEHVPAGEAIATRSENEATPRGPHLVLRTIVSGGESEQERGKRIVVEEGETLRVDFSQMEKPYVEGFVTCADGAVAGALVSASPAAGPGALPLVFGAEKEATTGADGSFRLSDLDPGDWRVSVRHPQGLVPTTATVVLEPGSPARQDFFLEGGVVEGDVVASKGGAKLEGATVALERVQSGESPAGVLRSDFAVSFVMARRGGASQQIRFGGGRGGARVSTDRGGHFRVPWVPAGKYRVSVSKPGFLDSRSDEIEVAPNGHVGGMKIELAPAAKLVVKLRSKSTGQPLSGCPVQLRSEDDESETGFTTAEGVAIFESLKPGAWTATGKLSWNDADGQSTTVTCESERTTEITLDL